MMDAAPDTGVLDWAQRFSMADAARLVPMVANHRCGTNLFKTSAEQFRGVSATNEVFSPSPEASGEHGFGVFLEEMPDAATLAFSDPEATLRAYLAWLLARKPTDRIILDIKYGNLYRLGVTPGSVPVPNIAYILAEWRLPVIHMMRLSTLREAISILVAGQTGDFLQYSTEAKPNPVDATLYLDPQGVLDLARSLQKLHADFADVIQSLGVRHHRIFYEDLRAPVRKQSVMRALHAVGVYCEPPEQLEERIVSQRSVERVSNLPEIVDMVRRVAPDLAAM